MILAESAGRPIQAFLAEVESGITTLAQLVSSTSKTEHLPVDQRHGELRETIGAAADSEF